MPLYQKLPQGLEEVDVIIAGGKFLFTSFRRNVNSIQIGGTAGCIVAGRLAANDPNLSILVIEGGKNNYNDENVVNPALFLEHIAPGSKTAIFYQGMKSEALAGRKPIIPSGGILGGGSSINFMM